MARRRPEVFYRCCSSFTCSTNLASFQERTSCFSLKLAQCSRRRFTEPKAGVSLLASDAELSSATAEPPLSYFAVHQPTVCGPAANQWKPFRLGSNCYSPENIAASYDSNSNSDDFQIETEFILISKSYPEGEIGPSTKHPDPIAGKLSLPEIADEKSPSSLSLGILFPVSIPFRYPTLPFVIGAVSWVLATPTNSHKSIMKSRTSNYPPVPAAVSQLPELTGDDNLHLISISGYGHEVTLRLSHDVRATGQRTFRSVAGTATLAYAAINPVSCQRRRSPTGARKNYQLGRTLQLGFTVQMGLRPSSISLHLSRTKATKPLIWYTIISSLLNWLSLLIRESTISEHHSRFRLISISFSNLCRFFGNGVYPLIPVRICSVLRFLHYVFCQPLREP